MELAYSSVMCIYQTAVSAKQEAMRRRTCTEALRAQCSAT